MILCTTVANPSRQIFYSSKETTENYGTHKETTVPINPNIALDATNLFFFLTWKISSEYTLLLWGEYTDSVKFLSIKTSSIAGWRKYPGPLTTSEIPDICLFGFFYAVLSLLS